MLCFCSVGNLQLPCSPNSLPQLAHHLWKPGTLVLGLGDVTVICYQERRTEEAPAPTVATLTSSSHISGARACGSLCSQRPHTTPTRTYLHMDNLLLLPSGPLPSHFPSHNLGGARRNVLHGRGGAFGRVSLLSGFR